MPRRRPNAELRRREHLTEAEVERLMEAAKGNRWGLRDATMVLVGPRRLQAWPRAAELVRNGHPARPQGQEGYSQHPSDPRRRTAGATAAEARAGAQVAVRVHLGAWSAVHHGWVCPHGRACRLRSEARVQSPPAHAQACSRLCGRQQGA
jgi:hypothetical protein